MRENAHNPFDPFASPAARTTVAVALLGGLFALLVALSAPAAAAAFALGGLSAIVVTRTAALLSRRDGIRLPGTDVRLRFPSF
jgi:hypothetical protein